jgi:hypothetical protein
MRLDAEKLEELRSWGEKLRQTRGEESAAVGRAILMLVEEIDRLHIDLWHARLQPSGREPVANDETAEDGEEPEPVAATLHTRLRRLLRRESDSAAAESVEPPASMTETAGATSAQAWIATLRRQK